MTCGHSPIHCYYITYDSFHLGVGVVLTKIREHTFALLSCGCIKPFTNLTCYFNEIVRFQCDPKTNIQMEPLDTIKKMFDSVLLDITNLE